jgi:HSP90 family molecular chaperone
MNDMMKLYNMGAGMPLEQTLILNTASPLVDKMIALVDGGNEALAETIARQVYMLSSLSQRQLTAEELVAFLSDSYDILGKL